MNDNKQPNTKAKRQDTSRRILAIVMAALMLLGLAASTVAILLQTSAVDASETDTPAVVQEESTEDVDSSGSTEASVSETDSPTTDTSTSTAEDTEDTDVTDTEGSENPSTPEKPADIMMRIGLMYGSGVTSSFQVSSSTGFVFGFVDDETDIFTPVWDTSMTEISACQDANLAKDRNGYYVPASQGVVIGGYHLELPTTYSSRAELLSGVDRVNAQLMTAGIYSSLIYAFPVYMNGALRVRIGDFGSIDSASTKATLITNATGETPTVIAPMDDAVTVLCPSTNVILFEARVNNGQFGVEAKPTNDGKPSTIMSPAKNTYEGVFLFKRYTSSKATGIAVTSFIALENYIAGVLPYEIGTSCDYECEKAFAIIVRSYTLATMGKHASYGIDLCNGTDCQVYMGTKRQNDSILRAVKETEGIVIAYDGEVCSTIYSAVTGGCTVDVEQIWNGRNYPYLRAVSTPWEDYESHPEGVWFSEVSGQTLYEHLRAKGYTRLKSAVSKIEIKELANNSTYVYILEITDSSGNILELKGTDVVRTALGSKYVNSANFVVAHKGEIPILKKGYLVQSADDTVSMPVTEEASGKKTVEVLTADGIKTVEVTNGLTVLGTDGEITLKEAGYDIPEDALARVNDKTNNNFIFIGKGWGHGGGISQWGAMSLSKNGATYDEIIHAYFTDVEIVPYQTLERFAET